jgi:hypothetical protein
MVTAFDASAMTVDAVSLAPMMRAREGLLIFNNSDETLYVKFGNGADATDFTFRLLTGQFYEASVNYTGIVTGLCDDGATGLVTVTELRS